MTKVGIFHGMVRFLQIGISFNIFAMAEVAMDVPNKTANINVKNRVYIQMLQTHTTAKIGTMKL